MIIERPKSKQPIPENAERVFKGVIFDVYQWEQEMYDGTKKTFERLKRPDTVSVFPILPNGKILLTDQEQPGGIEFIGAPGGRVDAGEEELTAAKRELLEETGYEADEWILWDTRQPVAKIDWVVFTFIAKGLKKVADLHLDGGEKIKLVSLSLDELIDMAVNGGERFGDKEVVDKFFAAKFDPKKREELNELFKPSEE